MRNRLIAAILGLFSTLTGVQAAPDVPVKLRMIWHLVERIITSGSDEASAGNNGYMWYEC